MQRLLALCTALVTVSLLVPCRLAQATVPVSPDRAVSARTASAGTASDGAAPAPAPDLALGAYLAGIVAGRRGDNQQAADFLFQALSHDPDAEQVRDPAFLFATIAGDPRAARLAGRSGAGLIAALVLANQAAQQGDWKRAADAYATLPGSPLTDAVRPLLLAWALQGAGETDRALRMLAAVPSGGPLAAVAALQAGTIADYAGRVQAAAALYQTAQAVFPSTGLATVQLIGGYLARNGHADQASAMVHELAHRLPIIGMVEPGLVAALDRPVVNSPAQGLARAYMAIAMAMQEQGNGGKEAAGSMLRFALDLDPGLTAARLSVVELLAADHPEAALAVLAEVPSGDPLAPLVALRSATLMAAGGQTEASIARLRGLAQAMPQRPEPWQTLGDVLSDAKRYADAIPAYDHAIEDRRRLNDGHLSGDDWQLLFSRAVAHDRQDQWVQARTDLDQALALSPTQPYVLNYLGYSLVERDLDLSQARLLIRRALDAKPDDGSIRDSLGWVMLRQGDVPGAVRTLERAAEQIPEDPTVNFHLGSAYWAAGRRNEAEDQWRWALVLGPEPSDLAKIRAAMQKAGLDTPSQASR